MTFDWLDMLPAWVQICIANYNYAIFILPIELLWQSKKDVD